MPHRRPFQPFSKQNWEALKIAEKSLADLLPELDRAQACGLECQAFRDVVSELLRRAALLREHFMTPPPVR